jgi:hypothetical protein
MHNILDQARLVKYGSYLVLETTRIKTMGN